jgi:thiol:disulfide interchange protein
MTLRSVFLFALSSFFAVASSAISPSLFAQKETAAPKAAVPAAPVQTYAIGAFDPARDAEKDLRDAVALAGKSGRRVLMDVGGEWCVWCRRLDTLWATNAGLRAYRDSNYVTLKVNWSPENKNAALLSKYPKIPGYPHFFVLEKDGKFLHSQDTGELEKGKGHDPEKVMAFLKAWAPAEKQAPK